MVRRDFRPVRPAGQPVEFCAELLFQRVQSLCLQTDQSHHSLPEWRTGVPAGLPVAGLVASTPEIGHVGVYAALLASVWLLHPIQLTSVLYAVQRMTSLSAFFLLAALLFHIMARRRTDGRLGDCLPVDHWLGAYVGHCRS